MTLRVIDRDTVRRLLTYDVAVPLMREAMIALSAGRTQQTLRQIIRMEGGAMFGVMPGVTEQAIGAKLISIFPANTAKGLQSHQGGVLLFEPESGIPVALVQAGEITGIRTAAASAAATDVLARPGPASLAILGTGEQAHAHAHAMAQVRPLKDIRVWGRTPERAASLAAHLAEELGVPAAASPTTREAVRDAGIVCTVSSAFDPILFGEDVAPGAHVNLVGSSFAGPREVDDALVAHGRLFADHREGALKQGAEIIHAMEAGLIGEDHVLGEIGQVMAGDLPGRTSDDEVTLYKSLGAVVQDLASGWLVYQRAVEQGLGTEASF